MEFFNTFAAQLAQIFNSSLVLGLILAIVYLLWTLHRTKKDYQNEIQQYHNLVERLQKSITDKSSDERDMLLSVIDKYHQSQIGIIEAISGIKSVLVTISIMHNGR